jgi:hypothetical protein
MKLIYRLAHYMLVLALSSLLVSSVYYAFSLLRDEQRSQPQSLAVALSEDGEDIEPRKPSPQEIVGSICI